MWSAGFTLEGRHIAEITSAPCVCYTGSHHENVTYRTERTGGTSVNTVLTLIWFTPSILKLFISQKTSKHPGRTVTAD